VDKKRKKAGHQEKRGKRGKEGKQAGGGKDGYTSLPPIARTSENMPGRRNGGKVKEECRNNRVAKSVEGPRGSRMKGRVSESFGGVRESAEKSLSA